MKTIIDQYLNDKEHVSSEDKETVQRIRARLGNPKPGSEFSLYPKESTVLLNFFEWAGEHTSCVES